jgi:hypothetical protein
VFPSQDVSCCESPCGVYFIEKYQKVAWLSKNLSLLALSCSRIFAALSAVERILWSAATFFSLRRRCLEEFIVEVDRIDSTSEDIVLLDLENLENIVRKMVFCDVCGVGILLMLVIRTLIEL